ncbi:hypothetical protein ASPVEDRAFT_713104 [Aspergillus versicolor CBS 583.65]|uniref:F-box domain-containing protein n=1 Tax=Aspergillus versicolor CBS 583.65 TaxID=1036611 RepID=A0A1L9PNM6_ASPVE|nr:uncharacterized protein ASPVEDRAFT_713104 [Aspergillus versicolor CBS 583.65]OJJ03046.1 hypothetical protein ASPVEDRAFT_713104 [Aspergillus versicolor CBS 583.65]
MGYSEVYCHLCGVSFNIARRRKPGEPDLASWDYTGRQCDEPGVDEVDSLEQCARNGCAVAVKYPKGDDDDVVNDPDYAPEDSDEEPYEYDSDHDSDSGDAMSVDEEGSTATTDAYRDFLSSTLDPQGQFDGEPVGSFGYSNTNTCGRTETILPITGDEMPGGHDPEVLEHIPGPNCTEANAYSGYRISLEEMRGCRTAQFLVHKSSAEGGWKPDGLHEPWETSQDWFLSGVCDGMASRDMGDSTVWPARGGLESPWADNVNFDTEWTPSNDLAMPFHPWCFDIFCRQSKAQFKHVNVSGLMKWRNAEFSWEDFHSFPRAGEVYAAQEQFWKHEPGAEYLVANPLYVPCLPSLLAAAKENNTDKSPEVTKIREQGRANLESLPLDIRLLIVGLLDSADITSLRMASTVFTNLPNSIWYRLVRNEMPWLWEAWDEGEIEHTPSPWTVMTANEMKLLIEERKHYSKILAEEYTPVNGLLDFLLPNPSAGPDVKLSRTNANWHQVYVQIKQNWDRLKGLRNRQRIWEDVEEVMCLIKKYS